MEPAVAPFREALDKVEISDPRFPVYCGATAAPFTDVRGELAEALIRPVRWRETFLALLEAGAEDFVETGPGTVLSKMARRITKETANA
jgi:malonyl CoA-acyl carrier protein transacylase